MTSELDHARIASDGSIFMGKNFCADGFSFQRKYSIYTHIHEDHIGQFDSSLGYCDLIIASKATVDLLKAIKGEYLSIRDNLVGLAFEKPLNLDDGTVTLFPATHILGSAQVLVETDDKRIVYTGDFDCPGTEPVECDILIIDSTHGMTKYDYSMIEKDKAKAELLELVRSFHRNSELPILVRAFRGRLQSIMHELRSTRTCNGVLFVSSEPDYRIAKVYQEYGYASTPLQEIDSRLPLSTQVNDPVYIAFLPIGAGNNYDSSHNVIEINSYGVSGPYTRINKRKYRLCWSDHADFKGLIGYIEKSGARTVITDTIRGQGYPLAEYINKEMGNRVKAIAGGG